MASVAPAPPPNIVARNGLATHGLVSIPKLYRPEADLSPVEIARRLLANDSVRSVTIDRREDSATVRYRDHRVERQPLGLLTDHFRRDDHLLGRAPLLGLPEVDGYADQGTGREAFVRRPTQAVGWRRGMHLALAGLWFSLAMIGVVVPGMPSTCFLLMTSYSLVRSSRRLHERLLASRVFGPSLRHWRLHHGVRPGMKTRALSMLVLVAGATMLLSGLPLGALAGIAGGASIGAWCILSLRVVEA
jgi:uncharacterized membrane protein YbaN (DUF454 family)